jgi:nucleoside-diphosphate-sugar epimerase
VTRSNTGVAHPAVAPHRVLLLGAGGWFGRTTLELLHTHWPAWPVLALTGRPRVITLGGRTIQLGGWEHAAAEEWRPTLVINCAFLTRDRVKDLGTDEFVAANTRLTDRFLETLALDSVRSGITVSSGAACTTDGHAPALADNPYGHLKWREEDLSRGLAVASEKTLVIARAWSVSGPHVGRPRAYAFSDLIVQAHEGRVQVRAPHLVWRRYVSVHDLMRVSVMRLLDSWSGTIDSGGPLVEIGGLARRVVSLINRTATVELADRDGSPEDRYHSDNASWVSACQATGLSEMSLDQQILATSHAFATRTG